MPRKTKQETENEKILAELAIIKEMLAERKHLDAKVELHEELMNGNGKPGFKQIRDKVLGWDNQFRAIIILIFGDIAMRIWVFVTSLPPAN